MQLIYYSIHPSLSFLWSSVFIDYFRNFIKYFQVYAQFLSFFNYILKVNSLIHSGKESTIITILYITFFIQLAIVILVLITTTKDDSKKKNNTSTVHTYSVRILSIYGLLLTTVAAIPSYNIFIAVIYCNKDSPIS